MSLLEALAQSMEQPPRSSASDAQQSSATAHSRSKSTSTAPISLHSARSKERSPTSTPSSHSPKKSAPRLLEPPRCESDDGSAQNGSLSSLSSRSAQDLSGASPLQSRRRPCSQLDQTRAPGPALAEGHSSLELSLVSSLGVDASAPSTLSPEEGSSSTTPLTTDSPRQGDPSAVVFHPSPEGSAPDTAATTPASDGSPSQPSPEEAPEPAAPLPPWIRHQAEKDRMIANRYVIGDELGRGAFGKVWRAVDVLSGQLVALKEVQKSLVAGDQLNDILREAALLREFDHPHIVRIIRVIETQRHLYFILDFIEGGSLHDAKSKFGVFPEVLLVRYMAQVLEGLRYLHSLHIVHRDIKGANILLTKDGTVKLADFGSCVFARLDQKLTMVGTPFWMAPEVIAQENNLGLASDIWSLGCTVIELLTGSPPYWKLGANAALFRMSVDPHPPLPTNISDELHDFLKQCFVRDPLDRPGAAQLLHHPWVVLKSKIAETSLSELEADQYMDASHPHPATLEVLFEGPPDLPRERADSPPPAARKAIAEELLPAVVSPPHSDPDPIHSPIPPSKKDKDGDRAAPKFLQFFREKERASSVHDVRPPRSRRAKHRELRASGKLDKETAIESAFQQWAGDPLSATKHRARKRSQSTKTPDSQSSPSPGHRIDPDAKGKKKPEAALPLSLTEVEGSIDGLGKFILVTPSRVFLRKGGVLWNSSHTNRILFLFKDLLLVTKKKTSKDRYDFKQTVYLDEFVSFELMNPSSIKMIDNNGRVPFEYIITIKDALELYYWIVDLHSTQATVSDLPLPKISVDSPRAFSEVDTDPEPVAGEPSESTGMPSAPTPSQVHIEISAASSSEPTRGPSLELTDTPNQRKARRGTGGAPSPAPPSPSTVTPVTLLSTPGSPATSVPTHLQPASSSSLHHRASSLTSGLVTSSMIPPEISNAAATASIQAQITDLSRRLEALIKKLDAESVMQIKAKQSQLKQLQGKVDDAMNFKASLDQSIEELQRWLLEIKGQTDILEGKISFLKDLGATSLVERNILANETRDFLSVITADVPPKSAESIEWIVPGALCQIKPTDDTSSWLEAVVTSAEMEARIVWYSAILIGSGRTEKVKASSIRQVQTDPKLSRNKPSGAASGFFSRLR